ncbi:hypothetical protein BGX21_005802, partial [Mortierella sp. AD011]
IATASKDSAIKSCLCHWASTAFSADGTGAAGSCITGTTSTCNSTQITQATDGMAPLVSLLKCASANSTTGSNSTGSGSTGSGSTPATGTSGSFQVNVPYVLSVAAVGLAALAGL